MKTKSFFGFFKPSPLKILVTFVVLCMPLLYEQLVYNNEVQLVWYRPLSVFASYLEKPVGYFPLFLMIGLSLVVYVAVSGVLVGASRLLHKKEAIA